MTPEVTPPSAANPYDLIVLGVFFFSAAMGIYRGLTKEVLSIAAWVGAGLTATFCYLPFRDMFRGFISYVFIADIANILVVFVTSLVIMTMLISTVSEKIKHSKLGGLDRSLGCLFGATRAFLMLEAIFLLSFMIWKKPEDRAQALPALQHARSLPFLEKGARILLNLKPEAMRSSHEMVEALSKPKPQEIKKLEGKHDTAPAYGKGSVQDLDRLFKTIEKPLDNALGNKK
jgi:membrane protein required for colicin V production